MAFGSSVVLVVDGAINKLVLHSNGGTTKNTVESFFTLPKTVPKCHVWQVGDCFALVLQRQLIAVAVDDMAKTQH